MMDLFSAKNTPAAVRGSSIAYRPELDGIRGFAVIIVVFHHFNYINMQYFEGRGFLGVDIFFALSGFLITQILLSYREKGIKLRKFYIRRIARLFPILFVSVIGLTFFLRNDPEFLDRTPSIASILYVKNFFPWDGVFAPMWSLSAEEQFYLLFPVFLLLGLKLLKKFRLTLFILLWLSTIWGVAVVSSAPDFNFNNDGIFNLVVFRPSIILIGCLAALHKDYLEQLVNRHKRFAFLLLVLMISFTLAIQFPPLAGISTALLILILSEQVRRESLIARGIYSIFAFKPLAWIGLLSYSIYIWQLPMIFFSSERFTVLSVSPIWLFLVKLLAVSCVSFYLFERPVLKLITRTRSGK
jgi:peptidoglycan/LPS O-acetylase OafA/YrhL